MAKKPFRKNYLTLEDVRISYDEKTDTVHITSKDKDIPKNSGGFHLALNHGRQSELILREMLQEAGLLTPRPELRTHVMFEDSKYSTWHQFPLGVDAEDNVIAWDIDKAPHLLMTGSTGGGKSVFERNIIFHCLLHPKKFSIIGIDLKKVELSPYAKYEDVVWSISKTVEEASKSINTVRESMLNRYTYMEEVGVNHYTDLPTSERAIILLIDEALMLLEENGVESDEEASVKREMRKHLLDISRLGRAAGVHLVLSTQLPRESFLSKEFKENIPARLVAGRVYPDHSEITLGNDEATKMSKIRGRAYFQQGDEGQHIQGYFATQDWFERQEDK